MGCGMWEIGSKIGGRWEIGLAKNGWEVGGGFSEMIGSGPKPGGRWDVASKTGGRREVETFATPPYFMLTLFYSLRF